MKEKSVIVSYDDETKKFECPNCGGTFSLEEVNRMFNHTDIFEDVHFTPIYCMDCGIFWGRYSLNK